MFSRQNKKGKKGLISCTSAHGTSSLRRHATEHHSSELAQISQRFEEIVERKRSKKRKRISATQVSKVFGMHKPYQAIHQTQMRHDQDFILLLAKANLPKNIVDNLFFHRYVHSINPQIKIPNRRDLVDKLIPNFTKYVLEKFVIPRLSKMSTVLISFDLWMSRGCQDIFNIIAHGLDDGFIQQVVHFRLMQCSSTSRISLAQVLQEELGRHNLTGKVNACVKDGGSNLRTCTEALQNIIQCMPIDLNTCFVGPCFADILSAACNKALSTTLDVDFDSIDRKKARSVLQKCITWTKKSGVGRDAWYASCRAMQKTERVMPTPIKTRFVSTVVIMSMMLKYRDVVERCFSNQESVELRHRVPSPTTWEKILVRVDTLNPIMGSCFQSQAGKKWLISDEAAKFPELYVQYRDVAQLAESPLTQQSNESPFEEELKLYRGNTGTVVSEALRFVIQPLLEF